MGQIFRKEIKNDISSDVILKKNINNMTLEDHTSGSPNEPKIKIKNWMILKKPLQYREIEWGIYNTSILKCNGFFEQK